VAGLSALQLMVPAVDPVLDDLRPRLPAGTALMDPGHISFGYPWLDPDAGRAVLDDVEAALAREGPFDVELSGPRRFPADTGGRVTVYLAPQPEATIQALNWIIADASGHDIDFTPHCGLVRLPPDVDPGPFERLVHPHLPLIARLEQVQFHVQESDGWHVERSMSLGTPAR
jgi:2'-5' RNA ligase superfamily